MLKDQINVNTYLNILIALMLAFFGYVGTQYEQRFDSIDKRFDSIDKRFDSIVIDIKENGRKIDELTSIVNDNRVSIAKLTERQNYFETRLQKVEFALSFKK